MRNYEKEIEKYKQEAERLKGAYLQWLGIISYLENKEKEEEKKEDK